MHLLDFLNGRPHLGLEDIESVALMDRYDSKFLVPEHWLSHTLTQLPNHAVLSIANSLSTTYRNLYFDSADNVCVQQHVRGKTSRFKVRIRHYTNTEVTFLEVKLRDVYGKTAKHRVVRNVATWDAPLNDAEREFLHRHLGDIALQLSPVLESRFERFTLVDLKEGERLTFDLGVEFKTPGTDGDWHAPLAHVSVVEWKQNSVNHQGSLIQALRSHPERRGPLGRPLRMSKYLLGRQTLQPDLDFKTYRPALRDMSRAESLAANPTFAPQSILR